MRFSRIVNNADPSYGLRRQGGSIERDALGLQGPALSYKRQKIPHIAACHRFV
jgi:hypothetical protein